MTDRKWENYMKSGWDMNKIRTRSFQSACVLVGALFFIGGGRASADGWSTHGENPQHTGLSTAASQPLDVIHWATSVDLAPPGVPIHYGSPIVTAGNTVIVPVKT